MGIGSIVLGVLSVICMIGGFLATLVPFVGVMLSFLSPVLALAGIVLGGIALSRSKSGGEESEGVAIGGLVTNVVVLIPSFLVAVTCGLCNTCVTGVAFAPPHDGGPRALFPDGGHSGYGYPTSPTYPSPTYPSPTYPSPTYPSPTYPSPTYPSPTVPTPATPPPTPVAPTPVLPGGPALPPPPLPPGPTRAH